MGRIKRNDVWDQDLAAAGHEQRNGGRRLDPVILSSFLLISSLGYTLYLQGMRRDLIEKMDERNETASPRI
jgi:hypothetical protein